VALVLSKNRPVNKFALRLSMNIRSSCSTKAAERWQLRGAKNRLPKWSIRARSPHSSKQCVMLIKAPLVRSGSPPRALTFSSHRLVLQPAIDTTSTHKKQPQRSTVCECVEVKFSNAAGIVCMRARCVFHLAAGRIERSHAKGDVLTGERERK
jgi:hypothetical protein